MYRHYIFCFFFSIFTHDVLVVFKIAFAVLNFESDQMTRRRGMSAVFPLLNAIPQDETRNKVNFCLHTVTHTCFETDGAREFMTYYRV